MQHTDVSNAKAVMRKLVSVEWRHWAIRHCRRNLVEDQHNEQRDLLRDEDVQQRLSPIDHERRHDEDHPCGPRVEMLTLRAIILENLGMFRLILVKILLASGAMTIVMVLLLPDSNAWVAWHWFNRVIELGWLIIPAILCYVFMLWIMGIRRQHLVVG